MSKRRISKWCINVHVRAVPVRGRGRRASLRATARPATTPSSENISALLSGARRSTAVFSDPDSDGRATNEAANRQIVRACRDASALGRRWPSLLCAVSCWSTHMRGARGAARGLCSREGQRKSRTLSVCVEFKDTVTEAWACVSNGKTGHVPKRKRWRA